MRGLLLSFTILCPVLCHAPHDFPIPVEPGSDQEPAASPDLEPDITTGSQPPDDPDQAPSVAQQYGASTWEKSDWAGRSHADHRVALRNDPDSSASSEFKHIKTAASPAGIPVLCYHQVEAGKKNYSGFNVPPARFEAQLQYLKSAGYQSLSQRQLIQVLTGKATPGSDGIPSRGVFLTFDDGLISHYRTVAPLLKRYGFRGTLFLYPTVLSSKKKAYMNWNQARELIDSGVFEAGSHSLYHPFLPEVSAKELNRQMRTSRDILERKLDTSIRLFAYPFGVYDRRVIAAARAAGYELAFTINTGAVRENENRMTLNRYMVTTGDSLERFGSYLRLESPRAITLQPADGSHVRPGQQFTLYIPEVLGDSVRVRLGKHDLSLEQNGSVFTGRLPDYKTSRGYLPLEVRAKNQNGTGLFQRFLYLDAAKF